MADKSAGWHGGAKKPGQEFGVRLGSFFGSQCGFQQPVYKVNEAKDAIYLFKVNILQKGFKKYRIFIFTAFNLIIKASSVIF